MKRTQTYLLVKEIVDHINLSFHTSEIQVITPASAGVLGVYKLLTCNTLWLTKGFDIIIDSVTFEVVSIDASSVTITGPSLPVLKTFDIYPPKFFHGTVRATVEEYDKRELLRDRLPMIWLKEMLKETFDKSPTSQIERISQCQLFFMIDFSEDWNYDEHCMFAVQPMRNLAEAFDAACVKCKIVGNMDKVSYEQRDHVKFGVYVESQGNVKKIFNANLTGTEINTPIPFKHNKICCS